MVRKLLNLMIGATLFCVTAAVHAQQQTLSFAGTINSVGSELHPTFQLGDAFAGSFAFNSTSPGTSGGPGNAIYSGAISSLSVTIDGLTYGQSSGGSMRVFNGPTDGLIAGATAPLPISGPAVGTFDPFEWVLVLADPSGSAFSSLDLPSTLPAVSAWSTTFSYFQLYFADLDTGAVSSLTGSFSSASITAVTAPIPEPETYAMLIAGLGLLGFEAHRRKKLQRAA
jgi:hypothetical protein